LNLFTRSDAIGLFKHVFRCRAYFCGEGGAFWAIIVFHVALPKSTILLRLQNLHRGIDTMTLRPQLQRERQQRLNVSTRSDCR
jgi:hypothetical protein